MSLFVVGILSGRSVHELLALLTALFICIVPEGLPVVFTLALTGTARRLAQHKVLVKHLQGAEGLGRVDVIVLDKTGTLTRNEMVVRVVYTDAGLYTVTGEGYRVKGNVLKDGVVINLNNCPDIHRMRDAAFLLDTSEKKYDNSRVFVKGEPTEAALGVFAAKVGSVGTTYRRLYSIPFDFESRLHIGFFERQGRLFVALSGAPEAVFSVVAYVSRDVREAFDGFLKQGYRVVALATYESELPLDNIQWHVLYKQLVGMFSWAGLVGIQDTIRSEIYDAVLTVRNAGVSVVMATGDHRSTAEHIARDTGILLANDMVVEGGQLAELHGPSHDLSAIKVFARVTPQDKLAIVNLLRQRGNVVAMTGDGINDVPSIVAADVGIAMGVSGTDMAKEVADLVLMDDSFTSIVYALEEGRHIVTVLRRVIWYFFSTNLSELLVIVYAFLVNIPLPLGAAQILWLNVITDGFLDVALATEPHEKGLLSASWGSKNKQLLDSSLIYKIVIDASVMTCGSLWLFYQWYPKNLATAQTMMLLCMALYQWFNAWNCRSETLSLKTVGFFKNKWLLRVTIFVFILQLLVIYWPPLQYLFHTVPLTLWQWLVVVALAASILVVEEMRKAVVRYRKRWLTSRDIHG